MNAPLRTLPRPAALAPLQPPIGGVPEFERRRLDALIERAILHLRARYQLSLDELRGLYVSDEQVDALLGAAETPDAPAELQQRIAALTDALRRNTHPASAWQQLLASQQLSRVEADVLLAALAPAVPSDVTLASPSGQRHGARSTCKNTRCPSLPTAAEEILQPASSGCRSR